MLVIGLTGGIGSGKSTVAEMFAGLGVPVIDADVITRELTRPQQPAFQEIVQAFGEEILDAQGLLDRRRLRTLIFSDERRRRQLEAILHPRVYAEIRARVERLGKCDYCIVVIPLLVETGGSTQLDRILVVDTPESLQRQRVAQRDQAAATEIDAILARQANRAQRLQAADDIIRNDQGLSELRTQVLRLHDIYRTLANDPDG